MINWSGVVVFVFAVAIFLRNVLYPKEMLEPSLVYVLNMNGIFVKISNSYIASKG